MCCSVLQCVAVCCSVLQCAAAVSIMDHEIRGYDSVEVREALMCCSVLQRVAACCSVLQGIAVYCSVLQCVAVCCSLLQRAAVCRSVLQCEGGTHMRNHSCTHMRKCDMSLLHIHEYAT